MANNLMVVFEKCDKKVRECKSDQEIQDWLVFKYMLVLENSKRFIPHEFKDKRIQAYS